MISSASFKRPPLNNTTTANFAERRMHTAVMEKLTEMLHEVCSRLDLDNVAAFRLVNRSCGAVGAEYLLPNLDFVWHKDSISRLQAVSQNSVLAGHVRSFYYNTVRHRPPESHEDLVRTATNIFYSWPQEKQSRMMSFGISD